MNPQTRQNLETAMHGEAFAHLKYLYYAEKARQEGHLDVADLFERAARVEGFEHFREEAELAGLVGSTVENLQNAIAGESYEVSTMYRDFAEQAKEAGDQAAADRFAEIRHDEMGHRDAFQAALESLTAKAE